MSDDWTVSTVACPEHVAWARDGGFLLASPGWLEVVCALGAKPLFAWSPHRHSGLAMPVFQRHGFRVGFFGFPVVCAPWDHLEREALLAACRSVACAAGVDLIRVSNGMHERMEAGVTTARPEVWVGNLQRWSASASKRLRRDLAYAHSASVDLEITAANDPDACHGLYASAVRSHAGKLRYTAAYFARLLTLTETNDRVRVLAAVDHKGAMRGFATLLVDGENAYYLHAATDEAGKRMGVSDLLLEHLFAVARDCGASRLSLMASPWNQPGLSKFKAKWGTTEGLTLTDDVGSSVRGRIAGGVVRWLHRRDRRIAALFTEHAGPR